MGAPWFRCHAALRDARVTWKASVSLGTSPAKAAGHLVFFWGAVSQHAPGGMIDDVPDSQLEMWAAWDGEPGVFARFVREKHSSDGQVNDYDEFNGKLEERRAKDRAKKAAQRSRVSPPPVPRDVLGDVPGDVPTHDTRRDDIKEKPAARAAGAAGDGQDGAGPVVVVRSAKANRPPSKAAPWMGDVRRLWRERFQGDPPAQAVKQLRPCVAEHGADAVMARLAVYLGQAKGQYVDLARFAATYGEWVPAGTAVIAPAGAANADDPTAVAARMFDVIERVDGCEVDPSSVRARLTSGVMFGTIAEADAMAVCRVVDAGKLVISRRRETAVRVLAATLRTMQPSPAGAPVG